MAVNRLPEGHRYVARSPAEILTALRDLPRITVPENGPCARQSAIDFARSLKAERDAADLERDIFLVTTPGVICLRVTAKNGFGARYEALRMFDREAKPILPTSGFLREFTRSYGLLRTAAPGIGITCEFLPDGDLKILAVHGPAGKDIQAQWPVLPPAHALLIALFEYLVAVAERGSARPRPAPKRRSQGGGFI